MFRDIVKNDLGIKKDKMYSNFANMENAVMSLNNSQQKKERVEYEKSAALQRIKDEENEKLQIKI